MLGRECSFLDEEKDVLLVSDSLVQGLVRLPGSCEGYLVGDLKLRFSGVRLANVQGFEVWSFGGVDV